MRFTVYLIGDKAGERGASISETKRSTRSATSGEGRRPVNVATGRNE